MIGWPVRQTLGTGSPRSYAAAMAGLWIDLQLTLARLDTLAADPDLVLGVDLVRARVRDVVRVDRCQRAGEHDQEEHRERREGDVVAPQPAPRQVPGAAPDDRNLMLFGGEVRCGVEGEIGCGLHTPPRRV